MTFKFGDKVRFFKYTGYEKVKVKRGYPKNAIITEVFYKTEYPWAYIKIEGLKKEIFVNLNRTFPEIKRGWKK